MEAAWWEIDAEEKRQTLDFDDVKWSKRKRSITMNGAWTGKRVA